MTNGSDVAASPSPTWWRTWFAGRRRWLWVGALVIGIGLWLGWDWLAAIGALPLLVSVLPCLAMCALGLCMRHGESGSCDKPTAKT